MKKIRYFIIFTLLLTFLFSFAFGSKPKSYAIEDSNEYYTVYDLENSDNILFVRGEGIYQNDEYISSDNKLYVIEEIDENGKTAKARFKENVRMPVYNVKRRNVEATEVYAAGNKVIAMYHTHNDECYLDSDGTDSVYGKGGIHDVGAKIKKNFENLGITVAYSEALHLPHNSGAYTRSETTASELIRSNKPDAIFDIHRDATPRSEYITKVNGVSMSKVRMVVGSANQNSAINKEFALCIKAYADEVYPGLIKDIYIGKGNYNQQLSERAMLFEMGCHNIEKELVLNSVVPLTKTIDMVLYGAKQASTETLDDIEPVAEDDSRNNLLLLGLARSTANGVETGSPAALDTLWVVLGALGFVFLIAIFFYAFNPSSRHAINRFFTELTSGIFRRKKNKDMDE